MTLVATVAVATQPVPRTVPAFHAPAVDTVGGTIQGGAAR